MKPFDLQKAIDGHPLVTRDRRKILEIKVFVTVTEPMKYKFVVYIENDDKFTAYGENGRYDYPREHPLDLFLYEDDKYNKCLVCNSNLSYAGPHILKDYHYGCQECSIVALSPYSEEDAFEGWKNFIDNMDEKKNGIN